MKIQLKLVFVVCVLLLLGCSRFGSKEESKSTNKERIVCLAKQYNEIIYALGAQKDLVAVDVSSTYPHEIKKVTTVGYHRALSAEAILATNPTLIIHDNNIGPEHVNKQLADLKIPMKVFDNKGDDIESAKLLMKEMGIYFHKEKKAEELCNKLDKDIQEALEKAKQFTNKPKVLVIHFGRASNVYLVMTKKSTANKMITWAGGEMAVEDAKGMKQLSAEVIAASDPDVILLTDFGYDQLGTLQKIKELPGVSATKAAKNNQIFRIEEADLVYIGPRTGKNVLQIQQLIHHEK